MTNQPLYSTNAHGDIWQEPELFDQAEDVPIDDQPDDDEDWELYVVEEDDDYSYSEATGDYGQYD